MDLTSKEGSFLPTDGLHIGPLKLKEIPNAVVECPYNLVSIIIWCDLYGVFLIIMIENIKKSKKFPFK